MKPISQLNVYRSARTPADVLKGILSLTSNPKRLLRGPRFSDKPSSGKLIAAENVSEKRAVSACQNGLIDLVARGGRHGSLAAQTREALVNTRMDLFPELDVNNVADQKGLRAFRKLVTVTLKSLDNNG